MSILLIHNKNRHVKLWRCSCSRTSPHFLPCLHYIPVAACPAPPNTFHPTPPTVSPWRVEKEMGWIEERKWSKEEDRLGLRWDLGGNNDIIPILYAIIYGKKWNKNIKLDLKENQQPIKCTTVSVCFYYMLVSGMNSLSCHNVDHCDWSHHEFHDAFEILKISCVLYFLELSIHVQVMVDLFSLVWLFHEQEEKGGVLPFLFMGVGVPSSHFPHPKFPDGCCNNWKASTSLLDNHELIEGEFQCYKMCVCVWRGPSFISFLNSESGIVSPDICLSLLSFSLTTILLGISLEISLTKRKEKRQRKELRITAIKVETSKKEGGNKKIPNWWNDCRSWKLLP